MGLEAASFAAAAAVGCAGQLLHARLGLRTYALAATGCIQWCPVALRPRESSACSALTATHPDNPTATAVTAMEFTLRVIFTIGAIGTALSITTHLLPNRSRSRLMEK